MGAPSKRARKIRSAEEFDLARLGSVSTPRGSSGIVLTSWTLAKIFEARDHQLRGQFYLPARMAESMRTDDALAPALENRLAPQRAIPVKMVPAKGARGVAVAVEADALFGQNGIGITSDTVASIHSYLVNHDVAFATCTPVPREDGSRIDYFVSAWPIEFVRWDPIRHQYMARVDPSTVDPSMIAGAGEVPIVHGDGRWIVFQRYEVEPYKHATILSAALVWARHAYAIRDWAKSSVAHGNAKMMGELPAGVTLQESDEEGNSSATAEAEAFIAMMRDMVSSDSPVGIRPSGSKTEFVTNMSPAWQVFKELVDNGESAAARIYLGTDGTMGAKGGAPGVDVEALFGVAATKIDGDLDCITKGFQTGVIEPWTALNFGDSTLAPTRTYVLPNSEQIDIVDPTLAARTDAFSAALKGRTDAGIAQTQEDVDGLAEDFKVRAPIVDTFKSSNAEEEKAALQKVGADQAASLVKTGEAIQERLATQETSSLVIFTRAEENATALVETIRTSTDVFVIKSVELTGVVHVAKVQNAALAESISRAETTSSALATRAAQADEQTRQAENAAERLAQEQHKLILAEQRVVALRRDVERDIARLERVREETVTA